MNQELAKQFCLKVVYGGELSAAEKPVLDTFLQTGAGQEFLRGSNEMKSYFDNMATVDLVPDPPGDLKERFEELIIQQAASSRKGVWILLTVAVLLTGISLVSIFLDGWSDSLIMPIIAIGCLGVCVLIGIISNRQILNSGDLTGQLKTSRKASAKILNRILGGLLTALPFILVSGVGYYRHGLATAVLYFSTCLMFSLTLGWFILVHQRNKLRRRDSEAWDWWENEIDG